MNVYGYVTLYIKYTIRCNEELSHMAGSISFEFAKPLTEEFFALFLEDMKNFGEQFLGGVDHEFVSIEYCTKEEYENVKDDTPIDIEWDTDDDGNVTWKANQDS